MVYSGKPSRGCQMCKTRRIKCDETKPACTRCVNTGRTCPGYKNEIDTVFRDETQATKRRATRGTAKVTARNHGTDVECAASPSRLALSTGRESPDFSNVELLPFTNNPQQPLEEQAACHFISNYVLAPLPGTRIGFMEFIVPILTAEKVPTHYKYAFEACALASLNNRVGNRNHFEKQALGKYTKALSTIFTALRDQEAMKEDATLASVLLLGLFENITAKTMGILAWGSHIEGAIHLTRARGTGQFRTKVGRDMFIAVRTQMIIHSLSTSKPPGMDVSWWIEDTVRNQHASECQRLCIKVGELRSEANRILTANLRTPDNIEIIIDLLRRCQGQDQACSNWSRAVPDYFQWKTVAWEDNVPKGDYTKAEVYPGRVDEYGDLWISGIWNMLRCARVVLNSVIVRCAASICAPVDYRTTPEYANAAQTTADIITDVIASVPYQLGWFRKHKDLLKHASLSSFACGEDDSSKGLSGYLMTWPLALIHSLDYLTDSQRTWVYGRLHYIGSQLGVRYALVLSQLDMRIPSMLVRKDGLMAKPSSFQGQSPSETSHSTPNYIASPLVPQHEPLEKAKLYREAAIVPTNDMETSAKFGD